MVISTDKIDTPDRGEWKAFKLRYESIVDRYVHDNTSRMEDMEVEEVDPNVTDRADSEAQQQSLETWNNAEFKIVPIKAYSVIEAEENKIEKASSP